MVRRSVLPRVPRSRDRLRRELIWCVPPRPSGTEVADQPLCFTQEALGTLVGSVGSRPAETGAKLFGPVDSFGVDVVEFDVRGSEHARGAVYAPDTRWGNERLNHWLSQPGGDQRLWTGDAHSHPAGVFHPSPKVGSGLGDLGYVESVFEHNEAQYEFVIPILTNTGQGPETPVRVNPWVVLRSDPHTPLWADLVIRPTTEFPGRRFNPAFTAGDDAEHPRWGLDLDPIVDLLESRGRGVTELRTVPRCLEFVVSEQVIQIDLSDSGFPVSATVRHHDGSATKVGFSKTRPAVPAEQRAADLVDAALIATSEPSNHRSLPASGRSASVSLRSLRTRSVRPAMDAEDTRVEAATTVNRPDYYSRADGLLTDGFHNSTIMVVGASGGSYLIEKLARLGPSRLILIDPDVVEVPNLIRTSFSTTEIGRSKVSALEDHIRTMNPFVQVDAIPRSIFDLSPEQVNTLLAATTVLIAGTDSFEAQAELNRWSIRSGTPAVFIGVHAAAAGGVIRWQIPGRTACYRCMAPHRYESYETNEGASGSVDLDGAPGLLIDVQSIDMVAATITVALIEEGADTPKGRLIDVLGDRSEIVVSNGPEYQHGQALFAALSADLPDCADPSDDLGTYLGLFPIVTLPCAVNPECPDCSEAHEPAPPDRPTARQEAPAGQPRGGEEESFHPSVHQ